MLGFLFGLGAVFFIFHILVFVSRSNVIILRCMFAAISALVTAFDGVFTILGALLIVVNQVIPVLGTPDVLLSVLGNLLVTFDMALTALDNVAISPLRGLPMSLSMS
ncbi:hypothetical protein B0O80DRAFT_447432 [Mortierella sp. GBAus27b]|nr:hypothetical protein B0O80DRAFT_447432 [Mortierella sp. GBAus27b]